MESVKVAKLSDLATGSVIEVSIGDKIFALCNVGGKLHALDGVCPHRGGPLGQGELEGASLTCPWHAWQWDCRTGENVHNAVQRVATFEVAAEGDDILLTLP